MCDEIERLKEKRRARGDFWGIVITGIALLWLLVMSTFVVWHH